MDLAIPKIDREMKEKLQKHGMPKIYEDLLKWIEDQYISPSDKATAFSLWLKCHQGERETVSAYYHRMCTYQDRLPKDCLTEKIEVLRFMQGLKMNIATAVNRDTKSLPHDHPITDILRLARDEERVLPTKPTLTPRFFTPRQQRPYYNPTVSSIQSQKIQTAHPDGTRHSFTIDKMFKILDNPREKEARDFLMANKACLACRVLGMADKHRNRCPFFDDQNNNKVMNNLQTYDYDDWRLNKDIAQRIFQTWYYPETDIFASDGNHQAPFYFIAPGYDNTSKGCIGIDAFSATWTSLPKPYLNPPWKDIKHTIKKLKDDKVDLAIVIAPVLPSITKQLEDMSRAEPLLLPHTNNLFLPKSSTRESMEGVGKPPWEATAAYLVTGIRKKSWEAQTYSKYRKLPALQPVLSSVDISSNFPSTKNLEVQQVQLSDVPIWADPEDRFTFLGTFCGKPVKVLRDTGSGGNLISPASVEEYGLEKHPIPEQEITYANSTTFICDTGITGIFKKGNYSKLLTFAVAPIRQDMILGLSWEKTITVRYSNWTVGKFTFTTNSSGVKHTWDREPDHTPEQQVELVSVATIRDIQKSGGLAWVGDLCDTRNEKVNISAIGTESNVNLQSVPENLRSSIGKYQDIFLEPSKLPPSRPEDMEIKINPSAKIPNRPLPSLSKQELEVLRKKLDELLEKGWIKPSKSPFGTTVLFAKKKDGSLRLCIDYRGLNNITEKDRTPLPSIQQIRDQIQGAKYLTKLDVRDAFHMVRIKPEDCYKTAFKTRFGLYEFNVVPFGLANSPATFIRLMNRIFGDLYDRCVIAYVDDIIIYSKTVEDHQKHVDEVLRRIQENQLSVKLSKCSFQQEKVEFGGVILSTTGISISPESISAITEFPLITERQHVQSFLGLVQFFEHYLPAFHGLAFPLTELTKKTVPWTWTPREHMAVRAIQHRIVTAPVLRFFDPTLPTATWTDASDYAIGGWIGQEHSKGDWYPCFYFSRKLKSAEKRYAVHERELLALVKLCKKYGIHLKGIPFVAHVDHQALIHLKTQPYLSPRQVRWVETLSEFQIDVTYLKGETNTLADWFSRRLDLIDHCPCCSKKQIKKEERNEISAVITTSQINSSLKEKIKSDYETDTIAKMLLEQQNIQLTLRRSSELSLITTANIRRLDLSDDGLIYYNSGAVYIPNTNLRQEILEFYHDTPTYDHHGSMKTLAILRPLVWWPSLITDVDKWTVSCDLCQKSKHPNDLPPGQLHPLAIPSARSQSIAIDFAEVPTDTEGFGSVMVIVDRLTKMVALFACQTDITAEQAATLFLNGWVLKSHGLPETIISDRDPRFTSSFWSTLCETLKITPCLATARHQQTDGQSEITIRIVKEGLTRFVDYHKTNWRSLLPALEYSINSSPSMSTGYAPYFLAYGLNPSLMPIPTCNGVSPSTNLLSTLSTALNNARTNILNAQERQRTSYNTRHRRPPIYSVGDKVLLNRDGIRWEPDTQRSLKLQLPWVGPFEIKELLPNDNIELILPPTLRIHPVFHISKIRPYCDPSLHFPNRKVPPKPAAEIDKEGDSVFEIDRILDSRIHRGKRQWLVRWVGYGPEDDLWNNDEDVKGREAVEAYLCQQPVLNRRITRSRTRQR